MIRHPDRRRRRDSGFVISLTLILVFTILVIGSVVIFNILRSALIVRYETGLIQDSAMSPAVVGKAVSYDLCEAPQILCRDTGLTPADTMTPGPTEGLFAVLAVRPDRFVSRDRIYYTGADCLIPAGETAYIAPPAAAATVPVLPVGYLNALEGVSYGVGAPRGWDFATMSPTGPGLLYRSADGAVPATPVIASVWTSLAPDCVLESYGSGLTTGICENFAVPLIPTLLEAVEVVDDTGTNLLELYTPPFFIQAPWLTFVPPDPAGENAPLVDAGDPGATMDPGLPPTFPDPAPEGAPAHDPDVPGDPGPGDPITTEPPGPEDG